MVRAKIFIYAKKFEGLPKVSDFELQEEELPNLKDGGKSMIVWMLYCVDSNFFHEHFSEILVEAIYLSVDPYMRVYVERYQIGNTMIGSQIAK